jgi:hypothetical protein
MELTAPQAMVRWRGAPRLIPSRYPVVGLFDRVASPADIDAVIELEGWTNDRIAGELGILCAVPRDEWVTGRPMATVVMAAYCHPRPDGSRFAGSDRGAWYAARTIDTALAESIYHRTTELREVGAFETRVQMRVYLADFSAMFHDVRAHYPSRLPERRKTAGAWAALYDPDDDTASQRFGRQLLDAGSNGIVYRSVRHADGECVACFRPRLVRSVRAGGHYEFVWEGRAEPKVRRM